MLEHDDNARARQAVMALARTRPRRASGAIAPSSLRAKSVLTVPRFGPTYAGSQAKTFRLSGINRIASGPATCDA